MIFFEASMYMYPDCPHDDPQLFRMIHIGLDVVVPGIHPTIITAWSEALLKLKFDNWWTRCYWGNWKNSFIPCVSCSINSWLICREVRTWSPYSYINWAFCQQSLQSITISCHYGLFVVKEFLACSWTLSSNLTRWNRTSRLSGFVWRCIKWRSDSSSWIQIIKNSCRPSTIAALIVSASITINQALFLRFK